MVNRKNQKILNSIMIGSVIGALIAGCSPHGPHKPVAKVPPSQNVSVQFLAFSDVEPILARRCVRCHNSGDKDWTSKPIAEKWAASGRMASAIRSGFMPLKGSPEASDITAAEKEKLLGWVASLKSAQIKSDSIESKDVKAEFVNRCMSCHGPSGTSPAEAYPNLAGHGREYFLNRLNGFLAPAEDSIMGLQLKALAVEFTGSDKTTDQLKELLIYAADYFTEKQISISPEELSKQRGALSGDAQKSYEAGKSLFVQRCQSCHLQADGKPLPMAAMVLGQKATYLESRMSQFKRGTGGTVMPSLTQGLTDQQLAELVLFLSHTSPVEIKVQ